EEVAVVRDGQGRHAKALGLLHQGVDRIGPVEQTVLGVNVEVDELGRHAGFLMVSASLTRRLILATTSFEVNPFIPRLSRASPLFIPPPLRGRVRVGGVLSLRAPPLSLRVYRSSLVGLLLMFEVTVLLLELDVVSLPQGWLPQV